MRLPAGISGVDRQAAPRLGERDPLEPPPLVATHDPVLVAVFLAGWLGVMALPTVLTGEVPSPERAYPGCPFADRCPIAEETCRQSPPQLEGDAHQVACFQAK